MKTTADFIDALKAKHGLKTNYAVAKFLNQTDTAVARWSNGKTTFSDDTAIQIADLLEIDPVFVVASVHAERAKQAEEKKLWERIATMTAGLAASLAIVSLLPYYPLHSNGLNIGMVGMVGMIATAPMMHIATYWPRVMLLLLLFFCGSAAADDYLVATVHAYHLDRAAVSRNHLNEETPGLGFERVLGDNIYGLGFYRNSFRRESAYATYSRTLVHTGGFSAGLSGGLATGYAVAPIVPIAGAELRYDYQQVGLTLIAVPSVIVHGFKATGFAGLQLRVKLP